MMLLLFPLVMACLTRYLLRNGMETLLTGFDFFYRNSFSCTVAILKNKFDVGYVSEIIQKLWNKQKITKNGPQQFLVNHNKKGQCKFYFMIVSHHIFKTFPINQWGNYEFKIRENGKYIFENGKPNKKVKFSLGQFEITKFYEFSRRVKNGKIK